MPPGSNETARPMNEQTAKDIGEIKGLLQGMSERMAAQDVALNRRMDDQHQANLRRLDDLTRAVNQRLDGQDVRLTRVEEVASRADAAAKSAHEAITEMREHGRRSSIMAGGSAAGLATVAIEFIKRMISP